MREIILVDGKKISGSIVVGVVIFIIGIITYQALTPDYLTKEEVEIARVECLEKENYYFTSTSNQDGNVLETACKFNYNIGESRTEGTYLTFDQPKTDRDLLLKIIENQERLIDLLEQKNIALNYSFDYLDENNILYDFTINQTIDDQNCFYKKDGTSWKFLYCE